MPDGTMVTVRFVGVAELQARLSRICRENMRAGVDHARDVIGYGLLTASPPCRPLAPYPAGYAETYIRQRSTAGIRNRELTMEIAGGHAEALEAHYALGTKHPDDFNLPLSHWDSTNP